MNLNKDLVSQRGESQNPYWPAERIKCVDGFSLSVQAHDGAYCVPRDGQAQSWELVEVGFPSEKPEGIMQYCESPENPTETVYGYVPVELVEELIEHHGGQAE